MLVWMTMMADDGDGGTMSMLNTADQQLHTIIKTYVAEKDLFK